MSELDDLKKQISDLSKEVTTLKEQAISQSLSEQLIQHIAGQIQMLFNDPKMLSGITSALLNNIQQALVFRAGQSKERQPQILVLDYYIPGSQRVVLSDAGVLTIEQQLEGSVDESQGWVSDDLTLGNHDSVQAIIELLQSYNIEGDKTYYLLDDITLQAYRENLSVKMQQQNEHRAREQAVAKPH